MNDEQYWGLDSVTQQCPWCGEVMEWVVDPVNTEPYVEDCYVCCRPCLVRPVLDEAGRVITVRIDCE